MSEKESGEQPESGGQPESGEQPGEPAAEIIGSMVEHAQFRSLTMALTDDIPLQHGDPQLGGIRPGQGTGHTPSSANTNAAPSSGTEDSSAADPE